MTWFNKQKWTRRRADLEREALAASVEELTAQEQEQDSEWEEEEEALVVTGGTALIPPVLRLQSRQLPIVRLDIKRGLAQKSQAAEADPLVATSGRRLGRSTRVRLQAVRPEQEPEPFTENVPVVEASPTESHESGHGRQVLARRLDPVVASATASDPSSLLCGSGVIEVGQEDAIVHNQRVSARSVVTVMLAGNPGPVVVHYVSLQPRAGFTLHLSAPVTATTPFNYAIWLF